MNSFARPLVVLAALAAVTAVASPDPIKVENTEAFTASVVSIDQATRTVTLKAANGNTQTMQVDPEVRNLEQVKVGDNVVVRYYEGLAAQIRKKGDPVPAGVKEAEVAGRAPDGLKPGGFVGSTLNSTVVIEAVDRKTNKVTFRNEKGETHTVAVKKPETQKFIAGLKKGDQVDVTFTQALAISVEPSR